MMAALMSKLLGKQLDIPVYHEQGRNLPGIYAVHGL